MEMTQLNLIEINKKIHGEPPENVRLYFLKKGNKKGKVSFTLFKTEITAVIGSALIKSIADQLDLFINKDVQYEPYSIETEIESVVEFFNDSKNVQNLPEILKLTSRDDLDFISFKKDKSIWGYIIYLENATHEIIYCARKYNIASLLRRGTINAVLHGAEGRFKEIEDDFISLDKDIDLLFYQSGKDQKGFILHKNNFERFFCLQDALKERVMSDKKQIEDRNLVKNVDQLIDTCKNDLRKLKKLYTIIQKTVLLEKIDITQIRKTMTDYNLKKVRIVDERMVVSRDNIWEVLSLLNDDYLKSYMTDLKYEAHSKTLHNP